MTEERSDVEVIDDILAEIALSDKPEFTDYELQLITDILTEAKESIND